MLDYTVHLTSSGLPLICTVCCLLKVAAKTTVDRDRGHHHHTMGALASGDITLMSLSSVFFSGIPAVLSYTLTPEFPK